MSMSLEELRSNPPQVRPERTLSLCLAPHLIAEVQSLTSKMEDLAARGQDGESNPKRMGDPRLAELRVRMSELLEEMARYEGQMRVRATKTDGEWRRWVNEHPARGEDEPGYERDQRVSSLVCNSDALIEDLATYLVAWNTEPLQDGDYAKIFEPNVASADKADLARTIVNMYESRLDFQRLRNNWSTNLERLNDLSSAENSESVIDVSMDGSLEPSNGATTERVVKSRSPKPSKS